jgi:hypothetical protein
MAVEPKSQEASKPVSNAYSFARNLQNDKNKLLTKENK